MTTHTFVKTSLAAGIGFAAFQFAAPANAARYIVNRTSDTHDANPGDGVCRDSRFGPARCSLRAAIEESNATPATAHVIDLATATYTLTLGELVVRGNQIIRGVSMFSTFVEIPASGVLQRPFRVNTSGTVDIMSLTMRNGKPEGQTLNPGGGLYVEAGIARLYTTRVMNNVGTPGGGIAVKNNAGLQLQDVEISGNRTNLANQSGGINWTGGGLSISVGGWALVSSSTIWGNEGQIGGAIYTNGYLELTNSTLSGNTSRSGGGGIFQLGNDSQSYVRFSTITKNVCNTAPSLFTNQGGGLFLESGTMQVGSSIVSDNTDGRGPGDGAYAPDCGTLSAPIVSYGYDLLGIVGNGCWFEGWTGDFIGTATAPINAQLNSLSTSGGNTLTHVPQATSPVIDTNFNEEWWFGCADISYVDQRGFGRPMDGDGDGFVACDIGAVERGSLINP